MLLLIIYFIVSTISNIAILSLMGNSPKGYEDENGFHYDKRNK